MDAPTTTAAKRLLALAAVAALAARAGAAEMGEGPIRGVRLAAAPIAGPADMPALRALPTLPALTVSPHLSQPSHLPTAALSAAGSPSADPRAAEAPRPAVASAGLQSVARALDRERADATSPGAAPAEAAPSAASRAFFDGSLGKAVQTGAVLASAAVPGGVALPAAYALSRYAGERGRGARPEPAPLARRAAEHVEGHLGLLALALPAVMAHGLGAGGLALSLIVAGLAFLGSSGMEQMLAHARNQVVGGWQASHDQKYRVDPATGRLKDVRGRKYGEDRYDERAPGPVSAGEKLWMRLVSAGAGALLLSAWPGTSALLYGAALTAGWLAADLLADRRPAPERVFSDEERAHAARFRD